MVLDIRGVTKRYRGGVLANDDVSLDVRDGEVVGLLGHNGAGKTTLVNQVIGIAKPDHGSITVGGVDAVANPARARELCAVQSQTQVPLTGLTPDKAIEIVGRIRGADVDTVRRRRDELIARLDLEEWRGRTSARLSGGVRRLVAVCLAAVVPPPLVVLDEPTNDVDPVRRRLLWAEIRRLADEGAGVLLVTHNVGEAERVVDRLVVLDEGRVVARGTPSELTVDFRDRLRLDVTWAEGHPPPEPPTPYEVITERVGARSAWVPADAAAAIVDWARAGQHRGAVETFGLEAASLEDAYIALVGREPEPVA